jgi:ferredoxin
MAPDALAPLRAALGGLGLHVMLPLTQASIDRAGVDLRLGQILPGAGGALIVGDGGGAFFAGFEAWRGDDTRAPDPLDHYTAQVIPRAVAGALAPGARFEVRYPFGREPPWIPFQRLGLAAGLPAPGPLGVQVHPRFGPWWAYRALVVVTEAVTDQPPLPSPCEGCGAPCATVCPADALASRRLDVDRCAGHRLQSPGCQSSCAARIACVAGPEHRYPPAQLVFHMAASLRSIARHYRR